MRVVMVSKALVVGSYQRLAEEIGRQGVELTVLCPPCWIDDRGMHPLETTDSAHFRIKAIPIRWNGHYHIHHYPGLGRHLRGLEPDLLHMDEEPYNLATWQGLRWAARHDVPSLFVTCQNLHRAYPPPFRWWERYAYNQVRHAIAGTQEARDVLRRKGYRGALTVNPQMGVDTQLFQPAAAPAARSAFVIGYAGGLLPEKGLDVLLRACSRLQGEWRLRLTGRGQDEARLRTLAESLNLLDRVAFEGHRGSRTMPDFYRALDVLVLPSRTRSNWKEQFGRVLIEAMACGVATVVSDSGEGRHVVGAAGLIYPEASADDLARHLQRLLDSETERHRLGAAGRQRVMDRFDMTTVATRIVSLYRQILYGQSDRLAH